MTEDLNVNQIKKPGFKLVKLLVKLQKFTLVLGIFLMVAVLFGGYHFILRPQYQQILERKQELESAGLEQQIADLEEYLSKLNEFIALTATISADDIERLNELLPGQPDQLVYSLNMKALFSEYNLEFAGLNFSEPILVTSLGGSDKQDAPALVSKSGSFADLFINNAPPETALDQSGSKFSEAKVSLKYLPIDFTVNNADYFTLKDLLIDLEQRLPLLDVSDLSLNADAPTADSAGNPTASLTVHGNVYFIETEIAN